MEISKRAVVELVRSVGRQDDAARAETELPDPVDTDRDAELLTRVGLDPETMRGHLRPEGPRGPSTDVGPAGGASTGRLFGKPTTAQKEYGDSEVPPGASRAGGDAGTSDASSGEPSLPGGAIGGEAGAGGEGPTLTGGAEEGAGFGAGARPAGGGGSSA